MDNRVLPVINLKSRGEKMALEIYLSARDQYLQEIEYTKVAKAEKKKSRNYQWTRKDPPSKRSEK